MKLLEVLDQPAELAQKIKRLALKVQQLAIDHELEYELKEYVAGVSQPKYKTTIILVLSSRQKREIVANLRDQMSEQLNDGMSPSECEKWYKTMTDYIADEITINAFTAESVAAFNDENLIKDFKLDALDQLVSRCFAPYSQYTKLS